MNWLRRFWERVSGIRLALVEAENARLVETNQVLELEVAQLRGEVRALENTVLSQAGVAPLPPLADEAVKPAVNRVRHMTLHQQRQHGESKVLREQMQLGKEIRERVEKRVGGS